MNPSNMPIASPLLWLNGAEILRLTNEHSNPYKTTGVPEFTLPYAARFMSEEQKVQCFDAIMERESKL